LRHWNVLTIPRIMNLFAQRGSFGKATQQSGAKRAMVLLLCNNPVLEG
jgi:hypothetical protein